MARTTAVIVLFLAGTLLLSGLAEARPAKKEKPQQPKKATALTSKTAQEIEAKVDSEEGKVYVGDLHLKAKSGAAVSKEEEKSNKGRYGEKKSPPKKDAPQTFVNNDLELNVGEIDLTGTSSLKIGQSADTTIGPAKKAGYAKADSKKRNGP